MSKFDRIDIKEEADLTPPTEIRNLEKPIQLDVKDFEFAQIKKKGEGDYAEVKRKYGPFAATDAERKAKRVKDARFSLNPLLRGPLSVEEEEKRVIEERVRVRIEAVADEAKSRASEEGFKEGYEKGHHEAYKKFREECSDRILQIDQFLKTIENAKVQILHENERFIVEMVYQIAKSMTLKSIDADPDYILRLAKDIIERIGTRENITIKINSKDAESMDVLKEGLAKELGKLDNVKFEVSDQVRLGGCKVESQWNAIDASLEKQLQNIYEGLLSKKKVDDEGEDESESPVLKAESSEIQEEAGDSAPHPNSTPEDRPKSTDESE